MHSGHSQLLTWNAFLYFCRVPCKSDMQGPLASAWISSTAKGHSQALQVAPCAPTLGILHTAVTSACCVLQEEEVLVPAEKLQATATSNMSFLQRYSAEQGIKLPSFGTPLMMGISPGSAYMEPELAWGRSVTAFLQVPLSPTVSCLQGIALCLLWQLSNSRC